MRQFILILFLLPFTFWTHAQNGLPSLDELSFDLKYCGGAVYKHTQKVTVDPPPFSQEVEFSISHRTYGKRRWERINNCPVPSINICYSQYGDALGNAFSFYPAIEWPILRKKNIDWTFKLGGGLGLATERWQRTDTFNNYLGSRLNNFTVIQTAVDFPISKQIELQLGGRMSHISNGAFRIPNFGINLFSGFVGLNYQPLGRKKTLKEKPQAPAKRTYRIGLRTGTGWGEQNVPNGPLAGIFSQSVFVATPFLKKHRIYGGLDFTYNGKARTALNYAGLTDDLAWNASSSTLFVGIELLYGRVGIPFQFGVFTKRMRNQDTPWYQKMGFQYYIYRNEKTFLKRVFAGPLLKSNKINADYIEFCVGVMF